MPRKTDPIPIKDPFMDRRTKLIPCQKEMIVYWNKEFGFSQRKLAEMFKVSRRTIQFVLDPEKLKQNKERREERGGWKQYYDKEKHAAQTRNHRDYKKTALKNRVK